MNLRGPRGEAVAPPRVTLSMPGRRPSAPKGFARRHGRPPARQHAGCQPVALSQQCLAARFRNQRRTALRHATREIALAPVVLPQVAVERVRGHRPNLVSASTSLAARKSAVPPPVGASDIEIEFEKQERTRTGTRTGSASSGFPRLPRGPPPPPVPIRSWISSRSKARASCSRDGIAAASPGRRSRTAPGTLSAPRPPRPRRAAPCPTCSGSDAPLRCDGQSCPPVSRVPPRRAAAARSSGRPPPRAWVPRP